MSQPNTTGTGGGQPGSAPQGTAPVPGRQQRPRASVTWQQMIFIILVNAVISALITVLLVVVILPALDVEMPVALSTPTGQTVAQNTQPAAQPSPTSDLVIHVVQSGETISALALLYDVPGEDIIAANNLENPNFLQVGAQLVIPVGGLPQATATLTPVPTPTDTPIPFEPPSADMTATAAAELGATVTPLPTGLPETGELQVEISEILGVGDVEQERVVIANVGERVADMQGWTLGDAEGNVYTFYNFRLWGEGSAIVHTRIGQDGNPPANFYWGKLEAIWSPGETATLRDANGAVISTYTAGQ